MTPLAATLLYMHVVWVTPALEPVYARHFREAELGAELRALEQAEQLEVAAELAGVPLNLLTAMTRESGALRRSGNISALQGNGEKTRNTYGRFAVRAAFEAYNDEGGASRFFYVAQARKGQRATSHPTEKPVELMKRFVSLYSPPGGRVLDPFCGSGSTLVAGLELGREVEGWDADAAWCRDARRRTSAPLQLALDGRKATP
jgi:hypothetical protein